MDQKSTPDQSRLEETVQHPPWLHSHHRSVWHLDGLSVTQIGKRVWDQMDVHKDDVFGRSAELAFYFLLAIFPLLLFFLTIFGFLVQHRPAIQHDLMNSLANILPGSANQLVEKVIHHTALHSAGWLLAVGILGALWSGSSGFSALITTLNFAYNVRQERPWWKARAVAVGLTVVVGVLILAAIVITIFGGWVAGKLGAAVGLGGFVKELWRIGQYAIALFFVVLAVAVLYRWAPNRTGQQWAWLTPGAFFAVVLWVAASIGLRLYLHYFNTYTSTYGSVGAVIILMLWFYILGFSLLTGAEINAVIEQTASHNTV